MGSGKRQPLQELVLACKKLTFDIYSEWGPAFVLDIGSFSSVDRGGPNNYKHRTTLFRVFTLASIQTPALDKMALEAMYDEHLANVGRNTNPKALDTALVVGLGPAGLQKMWHLFVHAGVRRVTGVETRLAYTRERPVFIDWKTVEWLRWVLGTGFDRLFADKEPCSGALDDSRRSALPMFANGIVVLSAMESALKERFLEFSALVARGSAGVGASRFQLIFGATFHRLDIWTQDSGKTHKHSHCALLDPGKDLASKIQQHASGEELKWHNTKIRVQKQKRGEKDYLLVSDFKLLVCATGAKSEKCRDPNIGVPAEKTERLSYSTAVLRKGAEMRKTLHAEMEEHDFDGDYPPRNADKVAPHLSGLDSLIEGSSCLTAAEKSNYTGPNNSLEKRIIEEMQEEPWHQRRKFSIMVEYLRRGTYSVSIMNIGALRQLFTEVRQKIHENGSQADSCRTLRKKVNNKWIAAIFYSILPGEHRGIVNTAIDTQREPTSFQDKVNFVGETATDFELALTALPRPATVINSGDAATEVLVAMSAGDSNVTAHFYTGEGTAIMRSSIQKAAHRIREFNRGNGSLEPIYNNVDSLRELVKELREVGAAAWKKAWRRAEGYIAEAGDKARMDGMKAALSGWGADKHLDIHGRQSPQLVSKLSKFSTAYPTTTNQLANAALYSIELSPKAMPKGGQQFWLALTSRGTLSLCRGLVEDLVATASTLSIDLFPSGSMHQKPRSHNLFCVGDFETLASAFQSLSNYIGH